MNVTIQNYKLVRDEFISQCETCEFYAIDQEMTGINGTGIHRDARQPFGSLPTAHFPSSRSAAMSYCAFQIGVCLYHKLPNGVSAEEAMGDEATAPQQPARYTARPYNFWLRPLASDLCNAGNNNGDGVLLNMSGVDFLLSNSMDFQFWLKNGMPYCTPADADKIRSKLTGMSMPNICEMYPDTAQWVFDSLTSIRNWASSNEGDVPASLILSVPQAPTGVNPNGLLALHHILFAGASEVSRTALEQADVIKGNELHPFMQKALMPTTVSANSNDSSVTCEVDVPNGGLPDTIRGILELVPFFLNIKDVFLCASPRLDAPVANQWRLPKEISMTRFSSKAEFDANEASHHEVISEKVRDATGFLPFFEALIACGKPQVGHNYSSDLMFLINQNHLTPLPETLDEFTSVISKIFPQIYDTKMLSENMPEAVSNTSLAALYNSLCARMVQRFGPNSSTLLRNGGNSGESSASAALQLTLPVGFESYSSLVGSVNGGESGSSAVAHQGAYDAFMTGVIYLQLQLLYGHASFVRPLRGWIAMFGCSYGYSVESQEAGAERLMIHRGYTVDVFESKLGTSVAADSTRERSIPYTNTTSSRAIVDRATSLINAALSRLIEDAGLVEKGTAAGSGMITVKVKAGFQPEQAWKLKANAESSKADPSLLVRQGSWVVLVGIATNTTPSFRWTRAKREWLVDEAWGITNERIAVLAAITDCLKRDQSDSPTNLAAITGDAEEASPSPSTDVPIWPKCPQWVAFTDLAESIVGTLPSGIIPTSPIGSKRTRSN